MKTFKNLLVAATLAFGGIAATAGGASAYVVCNRFGDCWHTDRRSSEPMHSQRGCPDGDNLQPVFAQIIGNAHSCTRPWCQQRAQ